MPPVELVWAVDRLSLYKQLEEENADDTFSLRGMLWFIITGHVSPGHVFVDDWPSFRHACCLHTTQLYAPESDGDMATMCTKDYPTIRSFFQAMSKLRDWTGHRSVVMCYVEERITQIAEDIFYKSASRKGKFWKSPIMRHYTALGSSNYQKYADRLKHKPLKITPGLVVDQLKPQEAGMVAEHWPYDVPDKEAMFRWLITILPSACVRDPEGRPVAWGILYTFTAGGAAYVLPEYRGKNLVEIYMGTVTLTMLKMCPTQRFFWILDDNVASQRQIERTMLDLRRTDVFVHWFSYTPDCSPPPGKAKL